MQTPKLIIPFYTKERWQNWVDQVKESGFKLEDQDNGVIFVYMTDDIVLACLKIITKYDKRLISRDDALKHVVDIKEIALKKIGSINEDIDMMFESTQSSLIGVFASCECYLNNGHKQQQSAVKQQQSAAQKTKSCGRLIKTAVQAEKENNMRVALDTVAEIGANIIAGSKVKDKDFDNVPEGLVAEWLDGVDSIIAAMVGDTSYKYDEPDIGD